MTAGIEAFLAGGSGERPAALFDRGAAWTDGKSTLIGRLLHDSKTLFEDHLAAVRNSRVNRAAGPIDFSLITDGLKAEREQGITIDVAYRYFATPARKFIIADTPGHEQYTRNMATGASTADLAVILIDAARGIMPQSRRHAYIAALLGIPQLVVAVNKMDLGGVLARGVRSDSRGVCGRIWNRSALRGATFIPISALEGDNVVERGARMPWFTGAKPAGAPGDGSASSRAWQVGPLAFPGAVRGAPGCRVSRIRRTDRIGRGAGEATACWRFPPGASGRVKRIVTYDGDIDEGVRAHVRDADARGTTWTSAAATCWPRPAALPHVSRRFEARLVWMHHQPLEPGRAVPAQAHFAAGDREGAGAARARGCGDA